MTSVPESSAFVTRIPAFEPNPLVRVEAVASDRPCRLHWTGNRLATQWPGPVLPNPTVLLALADERVGGVIRDNHIDGVLSLLHGRPWLWNLQPDGPIAEIDSSLAQLVHPGETLVLAGNQLARVQTRIAAAAVDPSRKLVQAVAGFRFLAVTDNVWHRASNSLVAVATSLSGNRFQGAARIDDVAVFLLAEQATLVGNQATEPKAVIQHTAGQAAATANLLLINEVP
jgi:hypothetical protein